MTGRHACAVAVAMGQRRHGFHKARLFIINLIAVNIDQPVIAVSQRKGFMQRLDAIFAGEFVVRNGADDICAQPQGFFQQSFAVGIGENALLGKRHYLNRDPRCHLRFQLQHRFQRRQ